MRIKFGTWIQACTFVSYPGGTGRTINAATSNGVYTIYFNSEIDAQDAYDRLLIRGYYDASDREYSNNIN